MLMMPKIGSNERWRSPQNNKAEFCFAVHASATKQET